jgi:exopolyphosphatase / guanosine-5'-triphosphate,3'-diphosphate pyrophosphatase
MSGRTVAVVDIGSNSIKLLVARRTPSAQVEGLLSQTIDTRISTGISQSLPELSEAGMAAGLETVRTLLGAAAPFHPDETLLVATSAVRDAVNGEEFRRRVLEAVGHPVRILTGHEEATYIGEGLLCDPGLEAFNDFYLVDLGGGSLECLTFRSRRPVAAICLPLGCVRLTERCVPDPSAPFGKVPRHAVRQATEDAIVRSGYLFALPLPPLAVFTGGTMTTVRSILGERAGRTLAETPARVSVDQLTALFEEVAPLDLETRKRIPGLPPARADVFPTALATLLTVAELACISEVHHSVHNLRWGIAAEATA